MIITDAAKGKIGSFLEGLSPEKVFRVGVSSGGCSGFSYITEISEIKEGDLEVYQRVVVDSTSLNMLKTATLDYIDTIGFSGFKFTNPDAKSNCGCGMSFDIE
jgi:iron-sulfur cluster assembly accessory protein